MGPPGKYNPSDPVFREIHSYIYVKKTNCLVAATGPVGTGKSIGGSQISYKFSKRFSMENDLVYNVKGLLDRTIDSIRFKGRRLDMESLRNIENLHEWVRQNRKHLSVIPGRAIVFDESGAGAFVRDFMHMDNRTLVKMIQIWRWLRILVVFVCPVNVNLMDSTIIKFVNMELKFKGHPQETGYSEFVALKYGKWNKKKREPYYRRIKGCRGRGTIRITGVSQEFIDLYDEIGSGSKVGMMIDLYNNYEKSGTERFTKKDAIEKVLKNTKMSPKDIAKMFDTDPAYIRQVRLKL